MLDGINMVIGDITTQKVCAIVNAANSSLLGGGGVDGAIHRAGGFAILDECKKIRETKYPDGLPTGEAVATTAGDMPARYVIHTVGPIYSNSLENGDSLLENCYKNSLNLAKELGCESITFPAISTGIYGYPKDKAAKVTYKALQEFLEENKMEVNLIFSSQQNANIFLEAIE